jgi:hypothetical protein
MIYDGIEDKERVDGHLAVTHSDTYVIDDVHTSTARTATAPFASHWRSSDASRTTDGGYLRSNADIRNFSMCPWNTVADREPHVLSMIASRTVLKDEQDTQAASKVEGIASSRARFIVEMRACGFMWVLLSPQDFS